MRYKLYSKLSYPGKRYWFIISKPKGLIPYLFHTWKAEINFIENEKEAEYKLNFLKLKNVLKWLV